MSHHQSVPGSGEPLSPEDTALLGEFGYDTAYIRKTGGTQAGLKQLVHMAELARTGALPPYDPTWSKGGAAGDSGRYGSLEDEGDLKGCLVFWGAALPGAALLIVFFIGFAGIFSHMQGQRADVDFEIGSLWADVAMAVVPFLLLDVVMRLRGRRILRGAPGQRGGDLQLRPSDLGFRPVPPVLQELVCLPLLTLIPVVMVQNGSSYPVNMLLIIVTLVLLGATGISVVLIGGPVAAAVLVVVWAPWCWIAVHGNSRGTLATVVLLIVTVAVMVVYFGKVMKAMSARDPEPEGSRS